MPGPNQAFYCMKVFREIAPNVPETPNTPAASVAKWSACQTSMLYRNPNLFSNGKDAWVRILDSLIMLMPHMTTKIAFNCQNEVLHDVVSGR